MRAIPRTKPRVPLAALAMFGAFLAPGLPCASLGQQIQGGAAHLDPRDIAQEAQISLLDAVARALVVRPGKPVEAQLEGEVEGSEVAVFFEVMIVGDDGQSLHEVRVDPKTGSILENKSETDGEELRELRGFQNALRRSELDLAALVRKAADMVKGVPVGASMSMENGHPVCEVLFANSSHLIEAHVEARAGHLIELVLKGQDDDEDEKQGVHRDSSAALGTDPGGQYSHSVKYEFHGVPENTLPESFEVGMTGEWKETEWSVRYIEGNAVLAHVGFWDEDPEGIFPVAWVEDSSAKDLTLSVRLFPVAPPREVENAIHDGAGIIVRFTDPDNYYLLRAVPHETRVRFYKVENGKRFTLAGKNIEVSTGRWHELELTARGSAFVAYFNGERLFTYEDKTFEEAGSFGLWCKPNNVTYYDGLKAEIIK